MSYVSMGAVLALTPGKPHPLGWVLTQLIDGDALGDYPPGSTPDTHNLSKLYGLTARQIVEGNGVAFTTAAIQNDGGWIHKVAGGKKYNGFWHFDGTTRIYLPAGGPRRPVARVGVDVPAQAGMGRFAAMLGIGAAVALLIGAASKKKKRGPSHQIAGR